MIAVEQTVLILLAAGRSGRFGNVDKLTEPFLGRPLALHVVTALEDVPFMARIVVKNGTDLDFESLGYRVIHNERPEIGMSESLKLGVAEARDAGAAAVLIALADMPRVTATHIYRLLDAADSADAVIASSDGETPSPPAIFGADRFAELLELDGDEGARHLVRAGRHVVTTPTELLDIDTPADLAKLRAFR
ncbi:MAG: nucleotidyltransferase family protein [Pseudomonadota bacterium]|nr:nucleotidyltransferase family protein [Pseudomonadota bacterium]